MRRLAYMTDERLERLDQHVKTRMMGGGVHSFSSTSLARMFPDLDRCRLGRLLSYYMVYHLPPDYEAEAHYGYMNRKSYMVSRRGEDK